MNRDLDWLTTDSTVYVDSQCELRLDLAGEEVVLRISGGAAQCHLVLAAGVAERLTPLLIEAVRQREPTRRENYMVVPIHPRTIPDPNLSGGMSAEAVISAAIR